MSIIKELSKKNLIHPPEAVKNQTHYLCLMGSHAYAVNTDSSDVDVVGWCIPEKEVLFPHLAGEIQGFGRQKKRFEQFQQHHVFDPDKKREYDITVYNVVKYFNLAMECNPNIIDSLFVSDRCIMHLTGAASLMRDSRKEFLHKGAWYKFKGYAYSQLHKMKSQKRLGTRKELFDKYGFDVKYAYHLVRLLSEIEQILEEGDLDLERNKEHLKAVRRGEVSEESVFSWASEKEKRLEKLYEESKLPAKPNESRIKNLLVQVLEEHYGSLEKAYTNLNAAEEALREIKEIVNKVI